jgi:hypothetical protein
VSVRGTVHVAGRSTRSLEVIVNTVPKFGGPNLVITIGLVPVALWGVAAATSAKYGHGMTDLFLAGLFGVAAYVFALAISGAGFLWAERRAKKWQIRPPGTTRVLASILALVLLAPWVFLLSRSVFGSVR